MAAGSLTFWLFDALPFQDLPAHAGLIAIRHRFAESAFDQRYYKLGSIIGPYAVFLELGALLRHVVGPLRAVRVLGTLPVLATPLALLFGRRRLHRDGSLWAGFMGVALSFGFMTLLGLASYLFALAILLVALTLWLELLGEIDLGRRSIRRELAFAVAALVVSLAHGYAFAVLVMLSGVTALAKPGRRKRVALLRALFPALMLAGWSAATGGAPPGSAGKAFVLVSSPDYQTPIDKLSLLVTPTLMTRTGVDAAVAAVVWGLVLAALVRTLRDPSPRGEDPERLSRAHSQTLAVGAAGAAIAFFALPHAFLWFGFIDGRMLPVVLFLAILGVRRAALGARLSRALLVVPPVAAFAVIGVVWFASYRFQAEAAGYREVLGKVPSEARLLNLPIDPDSSVFTAHPFVHYDKLVAVDEPVLLSDVWADRATALYPTAENPSVRLPRDYNSASLKRLDWPAFDLCDWSHVLVRTKPLAPAPLTPNELSQVAHVGGWWLYRSTCFDATAARQRLSARFADGSANARSACSGEGTPTDRGSPSRSSRVGSAGTSCTTASPWVDR
jgi:hypothetical protein